MENLSKKNIIDHFEEEYPEGDGRWAPVLLRGLDFIFRVEGICILVRDEIIRRELPCFLIFKLIYWM